MNRDIAIKIAESFLHEMNPDNWNGIGERPDTFDTRIRTYDIDSKNGNELDISFDYDAEDGAWEHYCELRDKLSGDLIAPEHGYGVADVLSLATTIEDICLGE